jgi:predicted MFS family arabinose efflux permease
MGIFNVAGSTLSGWLTDRYDPAKLLFIYYVARGVSLVFLPFAFDLGFLGISFFALFYGLDWIATLPPTARLTARRFGEENVGVYFGWIGAGHSLGAAMAAWGGGLLRVEVGDYGIAFLIAGALCFLAGGLVMFLAEPPRRAEGALAAPAPA